MTTHPFDSGREEMREQIISLIYERYIYCRTFLGRESEPALILKNLIHSIRDAQADEMDNAKISKLDLQM
jgi:hypothetical protein